MTVISTKVSGGDDVLASQQNSIVDDLENHDSQLVTISGGLMQGNNADGTF